MLAVQDSWSIACANTACTVNQCQWGGPKWSPVYIGRVRWITAIIHQLRVLLSCGLLPMTHYQQDRVDYPVLVSLRLSC